jgi:rRNA maturation endonuclease Nob1
MIINQDKKKWKFACQGCGTPYTSKPEFCYECDGQTVVPIDWFQNTTEK